MNGRIARDLLILLAIFGGIWALVAIGPWSVKAPDLGFNVEREQQLGRIMVEEWMFDKGGVALLDNETVDAAMQTVNDRLLEALGPSEYDHHIWVVKNDEINAITLPGGYILVYSGLITFSDSAEEVAAVIAHELGHVEQRHVLSRLIKEFGLQLLFTVVSGGDAVVVGELSRTALSNMFNRKQEEEADAFGWELMAKAGLDPRVLATFFRKLEAEHPSGPKQLEILNTHPHNSARIRASLEKQLPEGFEERPLDVDWQGVKDAVVR
jgi:beta-barrel assembly-enhancing protease